MNYEKVTKARFLERSNRFIARCEVNGKVETVHVRNTGRCGELLLPGVSVYLEDALSQTRKTRYSLVAVEKGDRLVNIDSGAPNKVVHEALRQGFKLPGMDSLTTIRPEAVFGASRFDFYLEDGHQRAYMEVKGVTLEEDGVVLFPDAPTLRGLKHVEELMTAHEQGYQATILFVVQMQGVTLFKPNDRTQPAFGEALRKASEKGVRILSYDCRVQPDSMILSEPVRVVLS